MYSYQILLITNHFRLLLARHRQCVTPHTAHSSLPQFRVSRGARVTWWHAVMCLVTQVITPGEVTVTSHHVPPPPARCQCVTNHQSHWSNHLMSCLIRRQKLPAVQVRCSFLLKILVHYFCNGTLNTHTLRTLHTFTRVKITNYPPIISSNNQRRRRERVTQSK